MNFNRLENFIKSLHKDVYKEPPIEYHKILSYQVIDKVREICELPENSEVLDVGYGMGYSSEYFESLGYNVTATTLNDEELERNSSIKILKMDQSFMDLPERNYDLVWARHVIEHSIMPFFTLNELKRLTKIGGIVYIEVPAPDTFFHHERNVNHYSVLTDSSWRSLIKRSNLDLIKADIIHLPLNNESDYYYSYICKRMME